MHVVTNAHVVAAGNSFAVTFVDGRSYECDLVGTDSEGDVAVLKIKSNVDHRCSEINFTERIVLLLPLT